MWWNVPPCPVDLALSETPQVLCCFHSVHYVQKILINIHFFKKNKWTLHPKVNIYLLVFMAFLKKSATRRTAARGQCSSQFIFFLPPPKLDEWVLQNFLFFIFKPNTTLLVLCATNTLKMFNSWHDWENKFQDLLNVRVTEVDQSAVNEKQNLEPLPP